MITLTPMAFDTKQELDDYVKNNPKATCKGISTEELLRFINENKGKYLFLKQADLCGADLSSANLGWAYLCGADLCGANLFNTKLCFADFSDADLSYIKLCYTDFYHAKYNDNTKFPEGFTIPETMIKL